VARARIGRTSASPSGDRVAGLLRALAGRPRFAAIVEAYVAAQARRRQSAFGTNALKLEGKIFALFTRDTLVVKLARARVDELVAAGVGKRFDPKPGRLMNEWLEVTAVKQPWLPLVEEAYAFAAERVRARPRATPHAKAVRRR
jgi:hypothetical protein